MMWWPAPSPMAPDRLEHLLIPQLSLAFLSSSPAHPYPGKAYRRLLLDNAVSADLLRRSRPRLRFSQKITSALMDEAVDSLSQAKAMHDDLGGPLSPLCQLRTGRRDRPRHCCGALPPLKAVFYSKAARRPRWRAALLWWSYKKGAHPSDLLSYHLGLDQVGGPALPDGHTGSDHHCILCGHHLFLSGTLHTQGKQAVCGVH